MTNETLVKQPLCFKRIGKNSIISKNVNSLSLSADLIDQLEASLEHHNEVHNISINIEPYFEFLYFLSQRLKTFGSFREEELLVFGELIEIHLTSFVDHQTFLNRAEILFKGIKSLVKDCGFDTTANTRYYEHALIFRVIKEYVDLYKEDPDFEKLPIEWKLDLSFEQVPDWFFSSARNDPRGNKNG